MTSERPSPRVVVRYIALQVPSWVLGAMILVWLHVELELSAAVAWGIGIFWVAKDIALFPLTWRAYAGGLVGGLHDPVGQVGICVGRLAPRGRVHVSGEIWTAIVDDESEPIEAGVRVRIAGRDGLLLRVRPESG